jgi:fibronectin-binding autotransporter adhesin
MDAAPSHVEEAPRAGEPGVSSPWWPFTDIGKTAGAGGSTTAVFPLGPRAGGAGGVANPALGSSPLHGVLMSLGDGVTGGAGGGSGATYTGGAPATGGAGGGGGGVMVICARFIVAADGSIRCRGGAGGPGSAPFPGEGGSGGGGGMGGVILIITDDAVAPVCDVTGGLGGAGNGPFTLDGDPGDDGIVYAISPLWGPL